MVEGVQQGPVLVETFFRKPWPILTAIKDMRLCELLSFGS